MKKSNAPYIALFLCGLILFSGAIGVEASSEVDIESVLHTRETIHMGAELVSFDVNSQGEILLLFSPGSGQTNYAFINIYDSSGTAKKSIELFSDASGAIRAWFDDDVITIYYLREKATFYYSDETESFSKVIKDPDYSGETDVLPIFQKSSVERMSSDTIYTLTSPGIFDAMRFGSGYTVTAERDGTSRLIWQDNGYHIRSRIGMGIVVILLVLMLLQFFCQLVRFKLSSNKEKLRRTLLFSILPCVPVWIALIVLNNNSASICWSLFSVWCLLYSVVGAVIVGAAVGIRWRKTTSR